MNNLLFIISCLFFYFYGEAKGYNRGSKDSYREGISRALNMREEDLPHYE